MNLLCYFNFTIPYVVSYVDSWPSLQNIIIPDRTLPLLFGKYLVDIRSEAWIYLFLEYINGKLFAVHIGTFIKGMNRLCNALFKGGRILQGTQSPRTNIRDKSVGDTLSWHHMYRSRIHRSLTGEWKPALSGVKGGYMRWVIPPFDPTLSLL